MFTSPCVNAFSVFGFDVKMYGVMIFLAIICGVFVSECIAKKYYKYIDLDVLLDFYPVMIISAGNNCSVAWRYFNSRRDSRRIFGGYYLFWYKKTQCLKLC